MDCRRLSSWWPLEERGLKLLRVEPLALLLLDGDDEADNGCAAASL